MSFSAFSTSWKYLLPFSSPILRSSFFFHRQRVEISSSKGKRREEIRDMFIWIYIYIYITNPLLFNPHQFSQLEEIKPQLFISFKTLTERDNKNLILARGMTWLPRAFFFLQIPRDGILSSTPFSGYQFESSCLSCPTYPASSQLSIFPRFSLQRERREREKKESFSILWAVSGIVQEENSFRIRWYLINTGRRGASLFREN